MKSILYSCLFLIFFTTLNAQDKNHLITSHPWVCDNVAGLNEEFKSAIKDLVSKTQSTRRKDSYEKYYRFLGNLNEGIGRHLEIPAKWNFKSDGTLSAVKVYNEPSQEEKLYWKAVDDNLIIFGINSDEFEVILYLKIEQINLNELILSKTISEKKVTIHYSAIK